MTELSESLDTSTKRIKDDIENMYNLVMRTRMTKLHSEKLELLRELEQKLWRTHEFTVETVRSYQ